MKGMHVVTIPGTTSIDKLRKDAVHVAKEIGYPQKVIDALWVAGTLSQINNILIDARHEWDVKPGRIYTDKHGKPSMNTNDNLTIVDEPEIN